MTMREYLLSEEDFRVVVIDEGDQALEMSLLIKKKLHCIGMK